MNVQLPCRWVDRPQAWNNMLYLRFWFERRAPLVRAIYGQEGVEQAWGLIAEAGWDRHAQP